MSSARAYRELDETITDLRGALRLLAGENQALRDRLRVCESALAAAVSDRDTARAEASLGRSA